MSKAKIFIELEIEINKTDNEKYDKDCQLSEIAENACGGVCYTINEAVSKYKRKTKITSAKYEYTISKNCDY